MAANPLQGERAGPTLLDGLDLPYETHRPVGELTWYGVGGAADLLARPRTIDQLAEIMRRCHESNVPFHVLGSGANLLVLESGVRGVVVRLDGEPFLGVRDDGVTVTAGAGADLARLILTTAKRGLSGLEVLAGIPASVGGAIRMNAGGRFGDIGGSVSTVTCLNEAGERVERSRAQLCFEYRRTNIPEPVIIEAKFTLEPADPEKVRDRVKEVFTYKKATQPLAEHSAGCAFKNPPPEVSAKGAGRLIDEAGLKGVRQGGAEVSPRHGNFIVLHAGGTANDILRLIRLVRQRVIEHCGVELEPEVVVWGEEAEDVAP